MMFQIRLLWVPCFQRNRAWLSARSREEYSRVLFHFLPVKIVSLRLPWLVTRNAGITVCCKGQTAGSQCALQAGTGDA